MNELVKNHNDRFNINYNRNYLKNNNITNNIFLDLPY